MSALLRAEQLSFRYRENITALSPVSFTLETGQIGAIVGASGSGKTTLLRLIGGQLEPTDGRIWLDNERVTGPAYNLVAGHPDIRTVFQDFALSSRLSVEQNIAHALRAYRPAYRQERTQELIRRFGLSGRKDHLPHMLSGGEQQRVALARALAEEPRLLLMDEPFSQADTPLKKHLISEVVNTLRETSGTALLVTHEATDALSLADQIVVLQMGSVVQQGTPKQIYEQPESPYVAQLMGECSIIPAEIWQQWFPNSFLETEAIGTRPEHIRLLKGDAEIQGKVVRSNYQGAYYRVVVELAKNVLITAHYQKNLPTGTMVNISIDMGRAIAFNENEAS